MDVMKKYLIAFCLIGSMYLLQSCGTAGGDFPGREFMPDMAHSTAYEANYYNYYFLNTWGTEDEYKQFAMPGLPVKGTIPRGYSGLALSGNAADHSKMSDEMAGKSGRNSMVIPMNGHVPYYYEDTEEDRLRAMEEITDNPFPITKKGLEVGKELYDIHCGVCHGPKGDGLGYLVRDDGGVYPAQPANMMLDEFIDATNGRYYHSIMHGRNVMGSYADKLSYSERWQVIHYIRSLQAKSKELAYSETENTLNNTAIPGAEWKKLYGVAQGENLDGGTAPNGDMNGEGGHSSDPEEGDQKEGGDH
jgi:hypothetical protein